MIDDGRERTREREKRRVNCWKESKIIIDRIDERVNDRTVKICLS